MQLAITLSLRAPFTRFRGISTFPNSPWIGGEGPPDQNDHPPKTSPKLSLNPVTRLTRGENTTEHARDTEHAQLLPELSHHPIPCAVLVATSTSRTINSPVYTAHQKRSNPHSCSWHDLFELGAGFSLDPKSRNQRYIEHPIQPTDNVDGQDSMKTLRHASRPDGS